MAGTTYNQRISVDDPLFKQKKLAIDNLNKIATLIANDKERIYSKIYFAASLFITIIVASYAEYLNWKIITLFGLFLIGGLIYPIVIYFKRRKQLLFNREETKKDFEQYGLEWREK